MTLLGNGCGWKSWDPACLTFDCSCLGSGGPWLGERMHLGIRNSRPVTEQLGGQVQSKLQFSHV
jgi:hypothetical protein